MLTRFISCARMADLWRIIATTVVALSLAMIPLQSQAANLFKTAYFELDLGTAWHVSGRPQNMPHSVNANFVNSGGHSSINIVVGSGQIKPYQLLTGLQNALRAQHAKVGPIEQAGELLYFEYILNGLQGYACSATNGKDVSSITVLGNPKAANNLLRTLKPKDERLFPGF